MANEPNTKALNASSSSVTASPPAARTETVRKGTSTSAGSEIDPGFAMILFGGPLTGGQVRDVRLANELAARGYRVHAWWAMDRPRNSPLRPEIGEHWLFSAARYLQFKLGDHGREIKDALGKAVCRCSPHNFFSDYAQRRSWRVAWSMRCLLLRACHGAEADVRLARRFARELTRARVTHVLPMEAVISPWVLAARSLSRRPFRYLVTFQGYEVAANYVLGCGMERRLYERLRDATLRSDWPAVAVSDDYARRVMHDLDIPQTWIRTIPPGVPAPAPISRVQAAQAVAAAFDDYRPDLPLVTFVGRRDPEKGIDLLLYAASILRDRGVKLQLAVCGPTLHGAGYVEACRQIARNLRFPVLWGGYISDELRSALFAASRAVVYPSIHGEPFGMVPVEAMAHGAPVVVPDHGGITEAIQAEDRVGGLLFRAWDSGHLADQIGRLLWDEDLWQRLSAAGPLIAEHYSVARMTDRILEHIGLPPRPQHAPVQPPRTYAGTS